MALFSVFDISATALSAQALRLNVIASNLANASSVASSRGAVYRARYPVFASILEDSFHRRGPAGGVEVRGITQANLAPNREYRPGHSAADEQGFIYRANINPIEQMADMISASRSFQGNIEVIDASKQMILRTLALGR